MPTNRVWRLRRYPEGEITDGVLSLEEDTIPELAEEQVMFRLNHADATLRKLFTGEHKGKLMIRVAGPG